MFPVPYLTLLFAKSRAGAYSQMIRAGIILWDNLAPDGDTKFVDVQTSSRFDIRLIIFFK